MMISGAETANVVRSYLRNAAETAGSSSDPTAAAPPGEDAVSLSTKATVGKWVSALHALPEGGDPARVQQLKAQVEAGTYQPDAHQIARQILQRSLSDTLAAKTQ